MVSLSDRLEQVRQTVAYHFGKVNKQIRLSINQEMLPETLGPITHLAVTQDAFGIFGDVQRVLWMEILIGILSNLALTAKDRDASADS